MASQRQDEKVIIKITAGQGTNPVKKSKNERVRMRGVFLGTAMLFKTKQLLPQQYEEQLRRELPR
ncbi:MAG: hypothetical protein ACOXZX_00760 [Synergistaceae bacterium]